MLNSTDSTSNFGSSSFHKSVTPPWCPLTAFEHMIAYPEAVLGCLSSTSFRLRQHRQSNPYLRQACSRLRQSFPPPIDNIPCRHPKSPTTLRLRGRQIVVHGRHHACTAPTAKMPKKAKNEFSGSRAVTNCTSRPAQPHRPRRDGGGSAPVGCLVILLLAWRLGPHDGGCVAYLARVRYIVC